ncbi:MAG: cation diffusion facilitator family transporter [Candidatus Hodarchaeota archaeon]
MSISDLRERYKDLKKGPRRSKIVISEFSELKEPHTSFLFGFLCLIYDGFETIEKIKEKMRILFISSTRQLVIEEQDVEEYLQSARRKGLVDITPDNKIILTKEGQDVVEFSYYTNLHTSYYMRLFFSEKTVMTGTAISLIILSSLKILVGLQLASQGMITEGMENFVDLVKIAIILILGMRLKKDKLASIIIICLMLFTGASMIWSSIEALLTPIPIVPTVQAYFIGFLSITINTGLMWLKSMVGRSSGNLSLLSDSKDSGINIQISIGVLIGLTFAIFKYYFVDSLVGIIIAVLIFKEGIMLLYQLLKKEEDFDITDIKVFADNIYHNRLTGYLLASIRRERITRGELVSNFEKGLELGRHYYIGFADFFYSELGPRIAEKHIDKLLESKNIEILNNELILTRKGIKIFYKAKAREYNYRANRIPTGWDLTLRTIYCLTFILIIVLLVIFANDINRWLSNF